MKIIFGILGVVLSFSSVFGNMPNVCENCQDVPMVNYEYDDVYNYNDYENEDICETYDGDSLIDTDASTGVDSYTLVSGLFQTQYFQTYYFSRLGQNIGKNKKDSCGFVAFGMLLSYWDTYWDDGIIPEKYEAKETLFQEYIDIPSITRTKFPESKAPGIKQEDSSIYDADQTTYYNNISVNGEKFFHFKLMDLFQNNIRSFPYDSKSGKYNYTLSYIDYKNFYRYYFKDYLGLSSGYIIDGVDLRPSSTIRAQVIDLVKQGIPVRLSVKEKFESNIGHCVIAYDYDEKTDKLYCNFGWGSGTTHTTIEDQGYTYYNSYTYIRFFTDHVHSDNYVYTDSAGIERSLCPCNLVMPNSIECHGDYALDVCPTFKWGTLITEKWFEGLYHEFSILDKNRYVVFTRQVRGNQYTLTPEEWKQVIELTGTDYYVYIGIGEEVDDWGDSEPEGYWDDFYYSKLFKEPTEYAKKVQVKPYEWGFEGRYWFTNEGKKETVLTKNDLTINTDRLRCGYIENSYVVLSPRRENAGEAYLEMNFDKPVYAFMYSVCLWSKYEKLDGIAVIFVKNANGDWVQKVDFLNDIKLKIRGQGLDRYVLQCPEGTYGIRIYCTATAEGTTNSGRLCFDDLVFCTNPNDTQFITLTYPKTTKPTTT